MGLGSLSEEQVCLKSGSWMAAILGGLLILLLTCLPYTTFHHGCSCLFNINLLITLLF